MVVKRPKGISSNLGTTGQWAVVVQRFMNGTGVIKVYLIQARNMHAVLNSSKQSHQNR